MKVFGIHVLRSLNSYQLALLNTMKVIPSFALMKIISPFEIKKKTEQIFINLLREFHASQILHFDMNFLSCNINRI